MTLVLERYIPAFPLELERVGPNARVTSLEQVEPVGGMVVIGPPGQAGVDGPAGEAGPTGPAVSLDDGFF